MRETDGRGQVRGWSMLHTHEDECLNPTAGKGTSPRALEGLAGEAEGQSNARTSMISSAWAVYG